MVLTTSPVAAENDKSSGPDPEVGPEFNRVTLVKTAVPLTVTVSVLLFQLSP